MFELPNFHDHSPHPWHVFKLTGAFWGTHPGWSFEFSSLVLWAELQKHNTWNQSSSKVKNNPRVSPQNHQPKSSYKLIHQITSKVNKITLQSTKSPNQRQKMAHRWLPPTAQAPRQGMAPRLGGGRPPARNRGALVAPVGSASAATSFWSKKTRKSKEDEKWMTWLDSSMMSVSKSNKQQATSNKQQATSSYSSPTKGGQQILYYKIMRWEVNHFAYKFIPLNFKIVDK